MEKGLRKDCSGEVPGLKLLPGVGNEKWRGMKKQQLAGQTLDSVSAPWSLQCLKYTVSGHWEGSAAARAPSP